MSAAELAVLGGIYVASWRRLRNLPRMLFTNPYVAFSITALFLGGLAYASFANLGILTRQKSLLFPFMLLAPCLPMWERRKPDDPLDAPSAGSGRGQNDGEPRHGRVTAVRAGALRRSALDLDEFWS